MTSSPPVTSQTTGEVPRRLRLPRASPSQSPRCRIAGRRTPAGTARQPTAPPRSTSKCTRHGRAARRWTLRSAARMTGHDHDFAHEDPPPRGEGGHRPADQRARARPQPRPPRRSFRRPPPGAPAAKLPATRATIAGMISAAPMPSSTDQPTHQGGALLHRAVLVHGRLPRRCGSFLMASSSAAVIIHPQVNSTLLRAGGQQGQQVVHEVVAGAGPARRARGPCAPGTGRGPARRAAPRTSLVVGEVRSSWRCRVAAAWPGTLAPETHQAPEGVEAVALFSSLNFRDLRGGRWSGCRVGRIVGGWC